MALVVFKRAATFTELLSYHLLFNIRSLSSRAFQNAHSSPPQTSSAITDEIVSTKYETSLRLSPLFTDTEVQGEEKGFKIEVVDDETWQVSQGLARSWRGTASAFGAKGSNTRVVDEGVKYVPPNKEDPDIDEIEDLRIRGNLFYKLDRGSKEFEEYNFEFHRRKPVKGKADRAETKKKQDPKSNLVAKAEKSSKKRDERKETTSKEKPIYNPVGEWVPEIDKIDETSIPCIGKKLRTPTFNQVTAAYHEPFCLDIYISKASVRACIIHRATSKVVAVAHSISKDMKFDLGTTRNANATSCVAVGEVLAQRALADDIHNAVYTPRKGEKLEGKLQIVLQAIINNGVNVKVKIKQRHSRKLISHLQLKR